MVSSCARSGRWQRLLIVVTISLTGSLWAAHLPSPPAPATRPAAKKAAVDSSKAGKAAPAPAGVSPAPQAPTPQVYVRPPLDTRFRSSQMQGSIIGTPGIWNTQYAETLLPGQASAGVYGSRYSRDPGGLVVTDVVSGWAVGVTKWLELSFDTTAYRRIRNTHPEELTFGRLGTLSSFNPVAPFARNPLIIGPVDWGLGATFGLLSQDRGDPFGLAVRFAEHLPYNSDYNQGVNYYGVSTTEPRFNTTVLIDKWLGAAGEMAVNLGYQHNGTVDAGGRVNLPLRDQFNYQ